MVATKIKLHPNDLIHAFLHIFFPNLANIDFKAHGIPFPRSLHKKYEEVCIKKIDDNLLNILKFKSDVNIMEIKSNFIWKKCAKGFRPKVKT